MEPHERGIFEKEIEKLTSTPSLEVIIHEMERLFPSRNLEDMVFGVIVGFLWGQFWTIEQQKSRGN